MRPYVIAIGSVSGGGKTALSKIVGASLADALVFAFDEFEATNIYPTDFSDWARRGADLAEFDCPGMAKAVASEIAMQRARFLVLDYPFGRDHPRLEKCIDLSIFIDTPLDVAMARRILRGDDTGKLTPEGRWESLKTELEHYLVSARAAYLVMDRHKASSDLILDGCLPLAQLRDQILQKLAPIGPK